MAGSYQHLTQGVELIENLGDAVETMEEMLFLIRAHLSEHEIEYSLQYYYACKRGDILPDPITAHGRAYLDVQRAIQRNEDESQ